MISHAVALDADGRVADAGPLGASMAARGRSASPSPQRERHALSRHRRHPVRHAGNRPLPPRRAVDGCGVRPRMSSDVHRLSVVLVQRLDGRAWDLGGSNPRLELGDVGYFASGTDATGMVSGTASGLLRIEISLRRSTTTAFR